MNNPANASSIPAQTTLGRLVGLAMRRWRQAVNERLSRCEVTEAGLGPLVQLARVGKPVRQKELADMIAMDTSSLVRSLTRLQKAGLIVSEVDPNDARAKALGVTEAGRDLALEAFSISSALEQEVLAGVDEEHIRITRDVLERVIGRLSEVSHGDK